MCLECDEIWKRNFRFPDVTIELFSIVLGYILDYIIESYLCKSNRTFKKYITVYTKSKILYTPNAFIYYMYICMKIYV